MRTSRPESVEAPDLLPFDTDDPEFMRGFEMGMLWSRDDPHGFRFHTANVEMVMRIVEAKGWDVRALNPDATWMELFSREERNEPW